MFDFLGMLTYCAYTGECCFTWEISAEVFRGECHHMSTSKWLRKVERGHKRGRMSPKQRNTHVH